MSGVRGMTLIEVLAALAILVVLSAGVVGFFFSVTARRDELARLAAQQRDTAAMLDRLEGALMLAVASAPDGSAGVRGDETSITVAMRSTMPTFDGASSIADASVLELRFQEDRARCDCVLTPLGGDAGAQREPVLEHVERMRFRYLRGRGWESSFDSLRAGGLPGAVEVSVWLEGRAGAAAPDPAPAAAAQQGEEDLLLADGQDSPFGPMDLPPPEPEDIPWVPREPDHVRVIVIPDAPSLGWGGGA